PSLVRASGAPLRRPGHRPGEEPHLPRLLRSSAHGPLYRSRSRPGLPILRTNPLSAVTDRVSGTATISPLRTRASLPALLASISPVLLASVSAGFPLAPTSDPEETLLARTVPAARDSFGNYFVTLGRGRPVILVAARRDAPAYWVTAITPDGYLRLQ